jgi:hypothetical protein
LQQFSRLDQIYIPCDGPVWVAESNLDVANVYRQRSRSALICEDGHGMLATWKCFIRTDKCLAQQLLILMLQSVGRGMPCLTSVSITFVC